MTGRRVRLCVMTTIDRGTGAEPAAPFPGGALPGASLSEAQVAQIRAILAEAASDPATAADVEAAIEVVRRLARGEGEGADPAATPAHPADPTNRRTAATPVW